MIADRSVRACHLTRPSPQRPAQIHISLARLHVHKATTCRACKAGTAGQQHSDAGPADPVQLPHSRRHLLQSAVGLAVALQVQSPAAQAAATSLTLQDVTPAVAASGPLGPRETAVISIFESATPAVVTVFDTTLMVRSDEADMS